jgi:IMP dehydrogenase
MNRTALTYDDISLIPKFSEIESRSHIDLTTQLSNNYSIKIPIVGSPMDTVCDSEMAIALARLGGVGIIHRFMSIEQQANEVKKTVTNVPMFADGTRHGDMDWKVPFAVAVGANGDYLERAQELVKSGANVILIDVAHGHHKLVKDAICNLKSFLPTKVDIIAGNVATMHGAIDLEFWGADAIRVGIGGGSLCITRVQTGFGVPNVTSIMDVRSGVSCPILACGGIRNSGDIAKALACGASSVILGSLLAGTKEAPGSIVKLNGLYKRYRGAASLDTKLIHNQQTRHVEGESTLIPFKGEVRYVLEDLMDGLKSALSYAGARDLTTYNPEVILITSAGVAEGKPHLIK